MLSQFSTWGKRCDEFRFMSDRSFNLSNPRESVFQNLPVEVLRHEGPEEWNNMWQKVRSIWKWAFENSTTRNSSQSQDIWYYICGTDTYVIVENLRQLAANLSQTAAHRKEPLYIGRRFVEDNPGGTFFNSGGAGYALNHNALALLIRSLPEEYCGPHLRGFWEDVMIAKCLREHGVKPTNTQDEVGEERFHPFAPAAMADKTQWPHWYRGMTKTFHGFPEDGGLACCSSSSISFHYVTHWHMRNIDSRIYS